MIRPNEARRKAERDNDIGVDGLFDLLIALGFHPRDCVSINTQRPGVDEWAVTIRRMGDLEGWSPPQDRNVWFGVNPVRPGLPRGHRGAEVDIARVRTLFADFDVKPGTQF